MGIKINIPNIGEDELEVTEILVKIGDKVNTNQPLLIIEGDKSSIEIPSPDSGIIDKMYIKIGDKVRAGSLILSLNKKHDYINIKSPAKTRDNLQYNMNEFNSLKNKNLARKTHNNMSCNKELNFNYNNNVAIYTTPFIRHMARTLGINLSKIQGSGRKGRIIREDIQNYLSTTLSTQHTNYNVPVIPDQSSTMINSYSKEISDKFGSIDVIQLNKIQKISGINLQKNWSTIPHVTQFDIVDVTNLEEFRKQQNFEMIKNRKNCKITMLIFIIKAVAKALEELPHFNSTLSKDGKSLILKKYINIGIAVDTKKGLLVPVLRNVNKKGIISLSKELTEIVQKARAGNQLTPIDMQGGTFTISNLGGIGGIYFTPIINAPEVAILGISKSSMLPVWIDNKFIPRLMLPLSLSYDHRVIDGADGARFINLVNKIVSDIRLLSM